MSDNTVLKKNKNIVSRTIGTETVLLPIIKNTREMNCIYTLNRAAARVWELIDNKRSLAQIKKIITTEFTADPDKMDKLMQSLISDLKEIRAVA